eukprot:7035639-Ditylum_brightwellii.AAC.1
MMQAAVSVCMEEFSGLKRILLFNKGFCCESRDGVTIDNGGYGSITWRFMPIQHSCRSNKRSKSGQSGSQPKATGRTEVFFLVYQQCTALEVTN